MRYTFGGGSSDFAIMSPSLTNNIVTAAPNATGGTAWSAESGGTEYTDLVAVEGGTPVTTDANGFINRFQGPDGITELWVSFGSGRFHLRTTDLLPQIPWVAATDYGVVADDATDNSTMLATALGTGKLVVLPHGIIRIGSAVTVPDTGGLIGMGPTKTTIRLTALDARVNVADGAGLGGGAPVGDFSIVGGIGVARTASVGLAVGTLNSRYLLPIWVSQTVTDAIQLNGTQNSVMMNPRCYNNSGNGLVFDKGAGSNIIINPGFSNCGGYMVVFRQTATGPYGQPTHNELLDGVYERPFGVGNADALGVILATASDRNWFRRPRISLGTAEDGSSLDAGLNAFKLQRVAGFGSSATILGVEDLYAIGNQVAAANVSTIFEMEDNTQLFVNGGIIANQWLRVFRITDTSIVDIQGYIEAYANDFAVKASGAVPWQSLIQRRIGKLTHNIQMQALTDVAVSIKREADVSERWRWEAGTLYAGDGASGGVDTALSRLGAGVWLLGNSFQTGNAGYGAVGAHLHLFGTDGSSFLLLSEQTVDPSAAAANTCRVFSRDNGSGKTQLCVRFPTGAVQVIATEP